MLCKLPISGANEGEIQIVKRFLPAYIVGQLLVSLTTYHDCSEIRSIEGLEL